MVHTVATSRAPVVEPIVLSVAQVKTYTGADLTMMGSGFFYTNQGTTYYITNRHLVIKEGEGYCPDRISLTLHTDASNVCSRREVPVDLYDVDRRQAWREYHVQDTPVDVVAIPLTQEHLHGCIVRPLSHEDCVPDNVALGLGQDLMVIGFPKGLSDSLHSLPVARNASLASAYPVPFNGWPYVLVDARLHDGTSGSPVLTKPMNLARQTDGSMMLSAGNATYLVGIHSASLDMRVAGYDEQYEDPLGLNRCWLATLLDGMTS